MKRIALVGANGMLAFAVKRLLPVNYRVDEFDLPEFDLTDRSQVLSLRERAPEIVINCAAYTNVDGCEDNRELATQVNGVGVGYLAELAVELDATLVHISTDFVFDGNKTSPYKEDDLPRPLSAYGETKLLGEQAILQSGLKKYYIARTSWLYGAGGNNFVETIIRLAKDRSELKVIADQWGTPTWTDDLARAVIALLQTGDYGIHHFSNKGKCNWHEFACEIVKLAKDTESLAVKEIKPIPTEDYPLPAERPKYSVLSKEKIERSTNLVIPEWQQSLKEYFLHRQLYL